ncbi:MAG: HAD-IA family hydrolase [Thermodesulfobacteriota bacterium]
MKTPIDLIVFDLDGTLVDSLPDLTNAANFACRSLGLPEHSPGAIQGMIGGGEKKFIRRFLGPEHQGHFEEAFRLYLEFYYSHCGELTRVYPGVKETLGRLAGKKLAVLSNKMERLSQRVVQLMGLAPFFAAVRGGDSYGALKPEPQGLMALIRELGAAPGRTLMVGDKPADVLAGREAGAHTLGVTYGYGNLDDLQAAAPELLIPSISELPDLLG